MSTHWRTGARGRTASTSWAAHLEFLATLAALTPRPEINLLVYHGVLAPHARWRPHVVGYAAPDGAALWFQRRPRGAG